MSACDGVLRKTWEAHCRVCEYPALGIRGEKPDAIAELRRDGWATRQGLWICPNCAASHPPGKALQDQHP